jgi:hypothetical protein
MKGKYSKGGGWGEAVCLALSLTVVNNLAQCRIDAGLVERAH